MADLTVQDLSAEGGAAVTMASAGGGGDKFVWGGQVFLLVNNTDSASHTVTLTPAFTEIDDPQNGELTRGNIVLAVAAGAISLIPPVPVPFRDPADGDKVAITYSAATGMKIAAVRIH